MDSKPIASDVNQVKITSLSRIQGQRQAVRQIELHLGAYFTMRADGDDARLTFGPVMLLGPPGVGKTMFAKAIHADSKLSFPSLTIQRVVEPYLMREGFITKQKSSLRAITAKGLQHIRTTILPTLEGNLRS